MKTKSKLLSFGEVLWDVYETEKFIGGAPLNFAAHFVKCGGNSYLLSAVGNDELGSETVSVVNSLAANTKYLSKLDSKETGKCLVTLDENSIPSYNLLTDVAWDYISVPEKLDDDFDVLYFGTLALRSEYNFSELKKLLENNAFNHIFVDVNIRAPHYSENSLELAFKNATIIKISDEELSTVMQALKLEYCDIHDAASKLKNAFSNLKIILITLGDKGAYCLDCAKNDSHSCPAKKTEVKSTVGAGDSFSAAFLVQYLNNVPIPDCLEFASKVSSFVVSNTAAIPDYSHKDFSNILL